MSLHAYPETGRVGPRNNICTVFMGLGSETWHVSQRIPLQYQCSWSSTVYAERNRVKSVPTHARCYHTRSVPCSIARLLSIIPGLALTSLALWDHNRMNGELLDSDSPSEELEGSAELGECSLIEGSCKVPWDANLWEPSRLLKIPHCS